MIAEDLAQRQFVVLPLAPIQASWPSSIVMAMWTNLMYGFWKVDIGNFTSRYYRTDLNGDGNVDFPDSPVLEDNITLFVYAMHP